MPNSPNMNLPIPVPSQTGGPQYALDEQSCFQQIDSHNHTPGQGSQIPLNALNINQNLSMSGYSIISLKSLQLQNQAISPGSSSLYMSGNDLYFSDGTGAFNVQITNGNAVAVSGAVGFSGLPSGTASAAYLSLPATFRFQSATNTAASLDVGPIKLRNPVAGSDYIGITPPFPLPSGYVITLPTGVPASNKILQMGAGGEIFNVLDVDNSTIQIVGNNIQLGTLPPNSVGPTQIPDASITPSKLSTVSLNTLSGPISGSVTYTSPGGDFIVNVSQNIITWTFSAVANRPVIISMQKDKNYSSNMTLSTNFNLFSSAGFLGFGGFGGPGPQMRYSATFSVNSVELFKFGNLYPNGNYSTSNNNYPITPFSFMFIPTTTGNQTLSIDVNIYGRMNANTNSTLTANIVMQNLVLNAIAF